VSGRGVEQSDDKAVSLLDKACQGGHLPGCYFYGIMEFSKASEEINKAKKRGTDSANTIIATNQKKISSIVSLLEDTCHKSEAESCHFVGCHYLDQGEKHFSCFHVHFSFHVSCTLLLLYFNFTFHVHFVSEYRLTHATLMIIDNKDRDPIKAASLLEKSCYLNQATSCFNLAVMYKHGDVGIPANNDKYLEYKKKTEDLVAQYGSLSGTRIA
jgi:TPR repeat protein